MNNATPQEVHDRPLGWTKPLFTPAGLAELLQTYAHNPDGDKGDTRLDHIFWALMEFEEQCTATNASDDPEYHDAVGEWAELGARLITSRPSVQT